MLLEASFVRTAAVLVPPVGSHGDQTGLGRGGVVPQLTGNPVAVQPRQPDVVLCDIGLPGLDGYGVARKLRDNPTTSKARLIAVTAYGQDEDRRRSHEAGFEQHLVKPVDPDDLRGVLDCSADLN